jgi:hypothetical protein
MFKRFGIYAIALKTLFGTTPAVAEPIAPDFPRQNAPIVYTLENGLVYTPENSSNSAVDNSHVYDGLKMSSSRDDGYKVEGSFQIGASNKFPTTRYFVAASNGNDNITSLTEFIGNEVSFSRNSFVSNGLYPRQLIVVKGGQEGFKGMVGQEISLGNGRLHLSAGPSMAEINALYNISLGNPSIYVLYIGNIPYGERMNFEVETQANFMLDDSTSIFLRYEMFNNSSPLLTGGLEKNF